MGSQAARRLGQVSERIARLPGDLFRYEILMTLRPLSEEAIEEIVDTIFLPLVHKGLSLKVPMTRRKRTRS
jgi:hypothetical protein